MSTKSKVKQCDIETKKSTRKKKPKKIWSMWKLLI